MPQGDRDHHQQAREAVQLARHQQQALAFGVAVAGHLRQVDEDPRQVEQAGEPAGHEDDVQGLDPGKISDHRPIMCGAPWRPLARGAARCERHARHKRKSPGIHEVDDRGCKALTLSSRKAPAQGGKAGDNMLTHIIRNGM
jgi:hypothetical protein